MAPRALGVIGALLLAVLTGFYQYSLKYTLETSGVWRKVNPIGNTGCETVPALQACESKVFEGIERVYLNALFLSRNCAPSAIRSFMAGMFYSCKQTCMDSSAEQTRRRRLWLRLSCNLRPSNTQSNTPDLGRLHRIPKIQLPWIRRRILIRQTRGIVGIRHQPPEATQGLGRDQSWCRLRR